MEFPTFLFPECHGFLSAVQKHTFPISFHWNIRGGLALVAGILILIRPKLSNFIIAFYLIVIGVISLFHFSW